MMGYGKLLFNISMLVLAGGVFNAGIGSGESEFPRERQRFG